MKKFIELKYHQNSKQEIVFENLDEIKEGDNVVLRIDNDLKVLFKAIFEIDKKINLFIPHFMDNLIYTDIVSQFVSNFDIKIYAIDNNSFCNDRHSHPKILMHDRQIFYNLLPKWNIPEDNAILFLSEDDKKKYNINIFNKRYFLLDNLTELNEKGFFINTREYSDNLKQEMTENRQAPTIDIYKSIPSKISIILPELHAEDKKCPYHKENINKLCKELKEKYGVERIELFVSHCFLYFYSIGNRLLKYEIDSGGGSYVDEYIDKITTTNSTSIFKVQKSDRLEVIDCVNFFDI